LQSKKEPLVKRGFYDASLDESIIRAMLKEAEKNYWDAVACQLLLAIHEEGKHEHN